MKSFILTILLFVLSIPVWSQHTPYFEVGLRLGGSSYLGDLAPDEFWTSVGETNPYGSISAGYNFEDHFAFYGAISYGTIGANDLNSAGDIVRYERNLSFRSSLYELSFITQVSLLPYRPLHLQSRFTPYMFFGIGLFYFNPKTEYQGEWVALRPLGTEGQGLPGYHDKYWLIQPSIPLGGGLKYALSENINISVQFGMRKTFTDYLDDVSRSYPDLDELEQARGAIARDLSWRRGVVVPDATPPRRGDQRGDRGDLDWYFFFGASISYNFIKGNVFFPPKGGSAGKGKCPEMWRGNRVFSGF